MVFFYSGGICSLPSVLVRSVTLSVNVYTGKDDDAKCRHNMRPSVQLPGVSSIDSKLGHPQGVITRDMHHLLEIFNALHDAKRA